MGFSLVNDSILFNQTIKLFKYIECIITENDDLMYTPLQMINESTIGIRNDCWS